jgi:hypothetical protein
VRKAIPIQGDGSIVVPRELVEEVFGKAREAVVHLRSGCLVLSPIYVDIESGQVPHLLDRFHQFESLSTVQEEHFRKAEPERTGVQFEGDLSVLALSDVFLFLSASKKSGLLLVQEEAQRWGFFFQNGNLVFAAGDDPKSGLAAYLLQRQFLTEQDLIQGANLLDDKRETLKVLLEISGLGLEEFREQWIRCVEALIFRVFGLARGRFGFQNGEVQSPFVLNLPMSTTNYVMEATRRLDEWARVQDRVPPLEAVLETPEDVTASTSITFEEEQVLSQITGTRTLQEVLLRSKVGEMEGKKAVASLIAAGLVRVVRGGAAPVRPEAASAALSSKERALLVRRLESYNSVFSAIFQALSIEVGRKVDVILGAFFKGLEAGSSLLAGLSLTEEGVLAEEPLMSRLAALPEERESALVRELNELLYFQLFAVKNTLGPDMEAGIVEMAKTLLQG